ncbi:hypothetical protein [Streptomyces hirsutus]|uniref:hypothetical protein n=1 Tax=Streptomyces hirsutus TaxID=35620 RepID=UPI0033BF9E75
MREFTSPAPALPPPVGGLAGVVFQYAEEDPRRVALVSQAESIRTFRILAQPFTEENGLLTPSLKLKRRAIEKAYEKEVEALYRA